MIGYLGFDEELDFTFLLGISATAAAESPFVFRFRFAMSCVVGSSRAGGLVVGKKDGINFCKGAAGHVQALPLSHRY